MPSKIEKPVCRKKNMLMSNIDYEKELNKEQLSAVRTIDGPLRIIAGAGSGKTRTLIYRVAWMLEHGIDSRNILLLTFTEF